MFCYFILLIISAFKTYVFVFVIILGVKSKLLLPRRSRLLLCEYRGLE